MKNLFLAFFWLPITIQAQVWTTYTSASTSTQLPNSLVSRIVQEKNGSMWFATDGGASHLNASTWKNYQPEARMKSMAIDLQGNKWFATYNGVLKFDGTTWTSYFPSKTELVTYDVAIDAQGNKWFAIKGAGISKFDGTSFISFTTSNGLASNEVVCLAIDPEGNVWAGTDGFGVSKFNGTVWTNYTTANGLTNNKVTDIVSDDQGNTWFACDSAGICKFDGTKWTTYAPPNGLANVSITSIALDSLGNKWITTYGGGVSKFNGTSWTTYTTGNGLLSNDVECATVDAQGNIWFGTTEGVSKFNGTTWTSYTQNGLPSNNVRCITLDNQDTPWFGTEIEGTIGYGASKFDGKNWARIKRSTSTQGALIQSIAIDKLGTKWFGDAFGGVGKYNDTTWTIYSTNNGLSNNNVQAIAIDEKGNKWFGTANGLSRFDGNYWSDFYSDPFNKNTLADNSVHAIAIDKLKNKWMGTNNGVSKFDNSKWTNYLSGTKINAVTLDAQGNKWFATENGLTKFDDTSWYPYYSFQDKPLGELKSMAMDEDGNLWLGGIGNAYKMDGLSLTPYAIPTPNASTLPNHVNGVAIDSKGDKWFGSDYEGVSKLTDGGAGPLVLSKVQKGIVFQDVNGDGKKQANESTLGNQLIQYDASFTSTQSNGVFYTPLKNGTHIFLYLPHPNWKLTTDSLFTVNVSEAPVLDTLFFGVQLLPNLHVLQCHLTGSSTATSASSKYWLSYSNKGGVMEQGTISLALDANVKLLQSIPAADTVYGNRLIWKFTALLPNETRQIVIKTQFPGNTLLGDTLTSFSKITSSFSQAKDTLKQILTRGSQTSTKTVHQGHGSMGYVLFGTKLDYTIYFQNLSSDTVVHLGIQDTLDKNMDISSLQVLASSHPVRFEMRKKNEAIFHFDNLYLPTKNQDELGSMGYVKYSLLPKKNLSENTLVQNRASLYFDFNQVVTTSSTLNTYVSSLPSIVTGVQESDIQTALALFPNPAREEVHLRFPQQGVYDFSISNLQGEALLQWNDMQDPESTFSIQTLSPGLYLYTVEEKKGRKYRGKLLVGR